MVSPVHESGNLPSLTKKQIQLPELDKKISEVNQVITTESLTIPNSILDKLMKTDSKNDDATPQKHKMKKIGTFDDRRKSKSKRPRASTDKGALSAMKTMDEAKTPVPQTGQANTLRN